MSVFDQTSSKHQDSVVVEVTLNFRELPSDNEKREAADALVESLTIMSDDGIIAGWETKETTKK